MNQKVNIIPKCYPSQNLCELVEIPNETKCGYLKTDGKGNEVECVIYEPWKINKKNEEDFKEALRTEARNRKMLK